MTYQSYFFQKRINFIFIIINAIYFKKSYEC